MEYLAVSAASIVGLNEKVNAALKKGFKLQGGISIAAARADEIFSQALYKDAPGGGKRKTRRNRK